MAFSFGFAGDDIEEDPSDNVGSKGDRTRMPGHDMPAPLPAKLCNLDDLLTSIPDKLSYSTISITSPQGNEARLPRREVFDVRLQVMAEDDGSSPSLLTGLDDSDIKPNVYEGGYKTWECSIDLVKFLLDCGNGSEFYDFLAKSHIVELGCGSALPSLLMFQHALKGGLPRYFTLSDYNLDVLRLVTVPNLLLTWISTLDEEQSSRLFLENGNPLLDHIDTGELYVTPELLLAFKASLMQAGFIITLISGSWIPTSELQKLVPLTQAPGMLIMGSETIYSPASLTAFAEAIAALMAQAQTAKTIVAAKRVYFGVGGSVDGFLEECTKQRCVTKEIDYLGVGHDGVRRCLLEVQLRK